MGATIIVNGRTVVHKDSGGKAPSVPDFCKTPTPPGPPVPIPYVNVAQSSDTADGSKKVKMDGNPIMLKTSKFSTSKGDEAGTAKGVASSTTSGIAKFANYSFDVKVESMNVPRLGDPMTNNGNGPNTVTVKELQKTMGVTNLDITDEELRTLCVEFCSASKYEKMKKQIAGGRRGFTRRVMQRLESLRAKINMRLEQYCPLPGGFRCFPDILLMTAGGLPRQVVDFKFPGDRVRRGQMKRWKQVAPTRPIILNEKTCEC